MNLVDGACAVCGKATTYTGAIPILCSQCKEERDSGHVDSENPKASLPDSELIPHSC